MKRTCVILILVFLLAPLSSAHANPKVLKAYKAAFEGEKPKCLACHVDEKPKKEGPHDLNDYGKKLQAAAEAAGAQTPDKAVYDETVFKQLGKAPEAS